MAKFKKDDRVIVAGTHTFDTMLSKGALCTVAGTRHGVTYLIEYGSSRAPGGERTWAWPASGVGLRLVKPTAAQRARQRILEHNIEESYAAFNATCDARLTRWMPVAAE